MIEDVAEAVGELVGKAFSSKGKSSQEKKQIEFYHRMTYTKKEFKEGIRSGVRILKSGGLVAFPTETVYGLGGDAFNENSVGEIYSAKGRPGDNPLILHIADIKGFNKLAADPPGYAYELADKFWPGPLTLVVEKKPTLPKWLGTHPEGVTDTVGLRMPDNPVAMALIKAFGRAVAAPSANKAGRPSPTKASHVLEDFPLGTHNIMVLDGGSVNVGLESTVVDITGPRPRILRPGSITHEDIWRATGLDTDSSSATDDTPRSPGQKYKHYAPKAQMTIVSGTPERVASYIIQEWGKQPIGVLLKEESHKKLPAIPPNVKVIISGSNEEDIARNLFANLRRFDNLGVEVIFSEAVSDKGLGIAIMDRMTKAAEGRIIYV